MTKVIAIAVDPLAPDDADTSAVGWPTAVPQLWATWVNCGWDLTHEATGRKIPNAHHTRICCRKHALEYAEALSGLDWGVSSGLSGDKAAPYREVIESYGEVWCCDDWEPRLTLDEMVEIVTHRLGMQGNEPDVQAVLAEAIRAEVVRVADTGGPGVDW